RPPHTADGDSASAHLHSRPLAHRHDTAARTDGAGRAARLPNDLRVHGPESLPPHGELLHTLDALAGSDAAAHGQHGRGLRPATGGRIRPVHAGGAVTVSDDRLPEPWAAVPGIPRPRRIAAKRTGELEAVALSVPAE